MEEKKAADPTPFLKNGAAIEMTLAGNAAENKAEDHNDVHLDVKEDDHLLGDKGKKGEKKEAAKVPFFKLFRYATRLDVFLMVVGTIAAMCGGAIMPIFTIIFGNVVNSLAQADQSEINKYVVYFLGLGVLAFIMNTLQSACWDWAAERQLKKVREAFVISTLRQDISWFDENGGGTVSTSLSDDCEAFREAIGNKVGSIVFGLSCFLAGLIIAMVKGWQLALVALAVLPLLAGSFTLMFTVVTKMRQKVQAAYNDAGKTAEEVISSVRTVAAFNAQPMACQTYDTRLRESKSAGIRAGCYTGLSAGLLFLVMFGSYGLDFWYGAHLIHSQTTNSWSGKPYNGGQVMSVFFCMMTAAMQLGQMFPSIPALPKGMIAGAALFQVIDRKSKIDSFSEQGKVIGKDPKSPIKGKIEFRHVTFTYPMRPKKPIFKDLSFTIQPGEKVAIVGTSGSGKSTVVRLLERFYDPQEGQVLIDDEDLKNVNVRSLRECLGLVNQEPMLFAGTIGDNIRMGRADGKMTHDEIIAAARAAGAHQFITERLKDGYNTDVGTAGQLLSGGEKQRVAIARAIARNPAVLLFDEATSALDTENERRVQLAIDDLLAGSKRTTLTIAHRLSTVRNSDRILVLSGGKLVEEGTHTQLLELGGVYSMLVKTQAEADKKAAEEGGLPLRKKSSRQIGLERKQSSRHNVLRKGSSFKAPRKSSKVQGDDVKQQFEKVGGKEEEEEGKEEEEEEEEEEPEEKVPPVPLKRILSYTKPDIAFIVLGLFSCAVAGAIFPIFAVLFAKLVNVLYLPLDEMMSPAQKWAAGFAAIGFVNFLASFGHWGSFGVVGERLTFRLRSNYFKAILRQNIGFFDEKSHSTGRLTARLATEASTVRNLATDQIGQVLQVAVTLVVALCIAFYSGWKLTLVILSITPFLVASGIFQSRIIRQKMLGSKSQFEKAGAVASEAVGDICTVAAFTAENRTLEKFAALLLEPYRQGVRSGIVSGLSLGFVQLVTYISYALAFWYGGRLVRDGEMSFEEVFRVFGSVTFAAVGAGRASSANTDAAKAKVAADYIFSLIDRVPAIDVDSTAGKTTPVEKGVIEFKDVFFTYPTRDVPIFKGLNLRIEPGQTTALVGSSGSGKSTIIGLLQRFYDPKQGQILLDGEDLTKYNVRALRSNYGLVSQEPILFGDTISNNIRYGKHDATQQEIEKAAQTANITNWLHTLPDGFNTQVGQKGRQISGGEKQRVCIARAVIRNPHILLLDEATSALDNESEALVTEALTPLMKGRTTVIIAHRLSTVMRADKIAVLESGVLVEQGTHHELLAKGGAYARLVKNTEAGKAALAQSLVFAFFTHPY